MAGRTTGMTALLISPNRELAEQFGTTIMRTRAFQIVSDLKSYPSQQTLDIRLKQMRPDVVLIDVATNFEAAGELIRYVSSLRPSIPAVGLHPQNDSEAILKSLRCGACEFLYAPFEVSIQDAALSRIQRLLAPDQSSERELGKVVIFSSAKPGSGASTLAAQTAFALRRSSTKRVLLADFDLTGGTIGFYLKLDQTYSVIDVLQHADRLDASLWSNMMVSSSGIDVLPSPEAAAADPVDMSRLHDVLQYARILYDWIIVDVPTIFNRISLLTLSESDRAFLISTSELASLHLARKAVKLLSHLGFDSKRFQILVNRVDKRDGLNGSDLNKLFDCQVDSTLPNDYFALHRVVAMGEPLDAESELGRAIDGLATKLAGTAPEKKPASSWYSPRPAFSQT